MTTGDARCGDEAVSLFVDGALARSADDSAIDVIDPSTGQRRLSIPAGCESDANRAVVSARKAFEDSRWSEAAPSLRKKVLHRFAELIAAEAPALDTLDGGEMGKPIREPFANAAAASGLARFYAEAVDKVTGDVYGSDARSLVIQRRVPRGVVAAVVPWNFPTYNAVLKIAPALAAGNSVVLKPSELSSRSAIRLAELALRADLPTGVLNVIPGLGETVGRALGLHGDVDMVTFTGSTEIGKRMIQYAGQSNMKVVVTECGGKSPQIVFDDGIDLDGVGDLIASRLLTNQGQICSVGSRLLVQASIERALIERIAAKCRGIAIGNALESSTAFGPVASAKQCARIMHYIEGGLADGAELVVGGRRVLQQTGGSFVEPTIFRRVSPSSRLAQEEIFGPVLSVIPFQDQEDAIRIANSTIYGLAAYVWTARLSTGMRMANAIRSSVWINAAIPTGEGAAYAASIEPTRQSGIGTEGGLAGMESYMRRQLVAFSYG